MPRLTPRAPSRRGKDYYHSSSSSSSQSTEFTLTGIRPASEKLKKAASVHSSVPNKNSANAKRTMSSVKSDYSKPHFGGGRNRNKMPSRRQDRVRSAVSEHGNSKSETSERARSGLGIFQFSKKASSNSSSGSFSRLTFSPRSESSFGRLTLRGTTRKADPSVPFRALTDTDIRGFDKIGGEADDALPRKSGVILPTVQQLREHKPKGGVMLPHDMISEATSTVSTGSNGYTPKGWKEAAKMGGRFISFEQHTDQSPSMPSVATGGLGRFMSFDQPGSTKFTAVSPPQNERFLSFDAAPKTLQLPTPSSRPMYPLQPKVSRMRQPQSLRDFRRAPSDKISLSAGESRKSSVKRVSGRIQRSGDYKTINAEGKEITHVQLSHRLKATTTNDLCGHCKKKNWPDDQRAWMTEDGRFYINDERIMKYEEFTEKVGFCTTFWLIQRPGVTLDRSTALRWGLLESDHTHSSPKGDAHTLYRPLIRLFLADRDEHGFLEGQYYATTDISSPSRRSFSKIALHSLTLEALKVLVEWTRRVGKLNTPKFETKEKITTVNALDAIDLFCKQNPGRVVGPLPKNSRRLA